MVYVNKLRQSIDEENNDYLKYSRLADDLDEDGNHDGAVKLRNIAAQEREHGRIISGIFNSLSHKTEEPIYPLGYGWHGDRRGESIESVLRTYRSGDLVTPDQELALLRRDYKEGALSESGYNAAVREVLAGKQGGSYRPALTPTPPEGESREFPKTYGDWVNLAEDIKTKNPSSHTKLSVNICLLSISSNNPDAEEAKRKLMEKARELGIA